MTRENLDAPERDLKKKPGVHQFSIGQIPETAALGERFRKLVIRWVVKEFKKDENAPTCFEPGCDTSGCFTLDQYPDKLVKKDSETLVLPDFEDIAIELEELGFSLEEIRELMAYRKEITVCLEHYREHRKLWEEERESENQ